jgi:hypothetical protein
MKKRKLMMSKINAKCFIISALLLGFTGFANTLLLAVDHDGFQQQPAKKSLNKLPKKSFTTKARDDDHHSYDGIQKPKENTKKIKMQEDALTERHHEQPHDQHHDHDHNSHHNHDGLKNTPKKAK